MHIFTSFLVMAYLHQYNISGSNPSGDRLLPLYVYSLVCNIGPVKQIFKCKIVIIFFPINLNICFGCSKETVLLSTHNICFG